MLLTSLYADGVITEAAGRSSFFSRAPVVAVWNENPQ